jgi:hypothetical protein
MSVDCFSGINVSLAILSKFLQKMFVFLEANVIIIFWHKKQFFKVEIDYFFQHFFDENIYKNYSIDPRDQVMVFETFLHEKNGVFSPISAICLMGKLIHRPK